MDYTAKDILDMVLYPIPGAYFSAWRWPDRVLTTIFWEGPLEDGVNWGWCAN